MDRTPRRDRTYRVVIGVFRGVFRLLGLRFVVRGDQHLPADGPAVIACNHLSYLDFTFVGLAASKRGRLVRFMAKQSTFSNRVSGPLMRRMGHIPVDREHGASAYCRARTALSGGELVGVFPEATISRSWTLKSFKRGAATLAVREQVPLVPVVLWAPQRTFTVERRYSVRRGKTIIVLVGEPLRPPPGADPAVVDRQLRERLQLLLDEALATYPDRPRDADDRWWLPACAGGTAPSPEVAAVAERERVRLRGAASTPGSAREGGRPPAV